MKKHNVTALFALATLTAACAAPTGEPSDEAAFAEQIQALSSPATAPSVTRAGVMKKSGFVGAAERFGSLLGYGPEAEPSEGASEYGNFASGMAILLETDIAMAQAMKLPATAFGCVLIEVGKGHYTIEGAKGTAEAWLSGDGTKCATSADPTAVHLTAAIGMFGPIYLVGMAAERNGQTAQWVAGQLSATGASGKLAVFDVKQALNGGGQELETVLSYSVASNKVAHAAVLHLAGDNAGRAALHVLNPNATGTQVRQAAINLDASDLSLESLGELPALPPEADTQAEVIAFAAEAAADLGVELDVAVFLPDHSGSFYATTPSEGQPSQGCWDSTLADVPCPS